MDELIPPAAPLGADTPLDPDPVLDADTPLDVDTPLDPYPLVFGPVGTLQKVAVISSIQKTPVVGAWVGAN